ncbi:MAG TPA: response regulator transcription factor [Verrucomicrobiae bacterium]|nr:response regulator transcription factor [Verrucomicrobiae bacterium]
MKPQACSKVFVADDSPIVRERLISMLTELPNVEIVGETGGAVEAIDSIRRLKPTAVVLDISMPGGGGMSVLETIKKEDQAPMVIMLTNFSNEPYRRRCLQLGADYFFDKSSEFEKVIQVLRKARRARSVRH